jgi:hypothetical protein
MGVDPLLQLVLGDEALTRGLGDAEARVLVEWLVERAEWLSAHLPPTYAAATMLRLCRRGRALARFVMLWCLDARCGAANQLAATERFTWPLPGGPVDPCELMQSITHWESCDLERQVELQERKAARCG